MPYKTGELSAYAKQIERRDPLTAKEYLFELGHEEEFVNFVLEGREDEEDDGEGGGDAGDGDEPHDGGRG